MAVGARVPLRASVSGVSPKKGCFWTPKVAVFSRKNAVKTVDRVKLAVGFKEMMPIGVVCPLGISFYGKSPDKTVFFGVKIDVWVLEFVVGPILVVCKSE